MPQLLLNTVCYAKGEFLYLDFLSHRRDSDSTTLDRVEMMQLSRVVTSQAFRRLENTLCSKPGMVASCYSLASVFQRQ